MTKHKSGGLLLPWLSAKPDGREGRFLQVGNSLLLDKRFQELSTGARQLYLCIAMESGGKREVGFPHSAAKKYGFPSTSFERYVKELQTAGFVEKVEDGNMLQFKPSVYRLTTAWKTKVPPQSGGT